MKRDQEQAEKDEDEGHVQIDGASRRGILTGIEDPRKKMGRGT